MSASFKKNGRAVNPGDIIYLELDDTLDIESADDLNEVDTSYVVIALKSGEPGLIKLSGEDVVDGGVHCMIPDLESDYWHSTQESAIRRGIERELEHHKSELLRVTEMARWIAGDTKGEND